MRLRETGSALNPLPAGVSAPIPCSDLVTVVATPRKDRAMFGMNIHTGSACCIEKVKTGRPGGCCAHIPHQAFVLKYADAAREETRRHGVKPMLDPEVVLILEKLQTPTTMQSLEKTSMETSPVPGATSPEAASAEKTNRNPDPWWQRVLMAPWRFLKWLVLGFWEDVKLIVSTRRSSF